jgi:hypothetical protein
MRSKPIIALAAVTAIAVVAAGVMLQRRVQEPQAIEAPAELFPGLLAKVNEVQALAVHLPESAFTVRRQGDGWIMPEKSGYPVKFETVKQAVVGMASLKPREAKTAKAENYPRIKVLDPRQDGDPAGEGALLRLVGEGDREIAALIVGATDSVPTSAREGWYYVRKPEEARTWLASGRLELSDKTTGWLDADMVAVSRDRIRSASAIQPDGAAVTVVREKSADANFKVENVPEGGKVLHETVPNSLGAAMGFLAFEDVKPASEVSFDGANKAVFTTFDGLVVTVLVVERDGQSWARFTAAHDAAAARIEAVDEKHKDLMKPAEEVAKEAERINQRFGVWAYQLPGYKADDFRTKLDKLVSFPEKDEEKKADDKQG